MDFVDGKNVQIGRTLTAASSRIKERHRSFVPLSMLNSLLHAYYILMATLIGLMHTLYLLRGEQCQSGVNTMETLVHRLLVNKTVFLQTIGQNVCAYRWQGFIARGKGHATLNQGCSSRYKTGPQLKISCVALSGSQVRDGRLSLPPTPLVGEAIFDFGRSWEVKGHI